MNNCVRLVAFLSLFALAVSCCEQRTLRVPQKSRVEHVVLIGLDGLAGHLVEEAEMPTLKKMMAEGAWTLQARSVLPSSSAVNWASTYMGVGTEMHGYNTWGSVKPDFSSITISENGIFPTIFTAISRHDKKMRTSAVYEWEVHKCLIDSVAVSSCQHIPMRDGESHDLTGAFIAEIVQNKPSLSIAIYDSPDVEGHEYGWGSPQYMSRLTVLDNHIADIVEATKSAGIYDKTLFIVMADHGGINKGHGGTTMEEMNAPLVFFGAGVKKGHQIQCPVMRYDVAPTIAMVLGVPEPTEWRGKAIAEILE